MSGEAVAMFLSGRGVLITDVAEDPAGLSTRVYISGEHTDDGHYDRRYILVSDPELRENARRAWRSQRHVVADRDELLAAGPLLRERVR